MSYQAKESVQFFFAPDSTNCQKVLISGRSQNSSIKGQIRLKMWLSTRENRGLNEEEDMWNEIWQHQQIYTIFLLHTLGSSFKVNVILKDQKNFLDSAQT